MRASSKLRSSTHPVLNLSHPTPDSFVWNTIIRAHARSGAVSALAIYLRMRLQGVRPDSYTFPFLLQSFSCPSHLQLGGQIHADILRVGLASNDFVQTSLINMYSSCGNLSSALQLFDETPQPDLPSWNSIISAHVKLGSLENARKLFEKVPKRNVITWSIMIDGHVKCGDYKQALELFRDMHLIEIDGVQPDEFTMSSVLSACGRLGALELGKWVHAYIGRCGLKVNVVLGTSLIDMYAKCGSIERARWVFNGLGQNKDVMAWSAMISGLAMHGHGKECLDLFSQMQDCGVRPDDVTFVGVLCACVHMGLVNEGREYFERMTEEFGITSTIQHYGCMVDLYGRAGLIDKAWDVVKSMPMKPDVLIWGSLLSGSRIHDNIEMCEFAIKQLIELEPMNSGAYVLLSNVYAKMGRWNDVRYVRDLMGAKGIKTLPGCSLVELEGVLR